MKPNQYASEGKIVQIQVFDVLYNNLVCNLVYIRDLNNRTKIKIEDSACINNLFINRMNQAISALDSMEMIRAHTSNF